MSRRDRIILLTGLLLLGVLCSWGAAWFLDNHERVTREVRRGQSPLARRNPLLAAKRFLGLLGVQAYSISGREHLLKPPAEKGAFIVHHLGPSLPRANEDAWVEWMMNAGWMILTAEVEEDDDAQPNRLLTRFDVHLYRIESGEGDTYDNEEERVQLLHFSDQNEPVNITLDPTRVLEDDAERADLAIQGPDGPYLLLPQAQLDRFLLKVFIDYPDLDEERALVRKVTDNAVGDLLDTSAIRKLLSPAEILQLQTETAALEVDEQIYDYAVRIVRHARDWHGIEHGAGPRGGIALLRAARANALLEGRRYVIPDDVKAVAAPPFKTHYRS